MACFLSVFGVDIPSRLAVLASLFLIACGQPASRVANDATAPHSDAASQPVDVSAAQAAVGSLPPPYNEASYESGRRVFAQCRSCHTLAEGAPHRAGPNLHDVFGREVGSAAGFRYSQAVQDANFFWDAEQLDEWLQNPQSFLPGNRMAFAGIRDKAQRRDLIAYLQIETAPQR